MLLDISKVRQKGVEGSLQCFPQQERLFQQVEGHTPHTNSVLSGQTAEKQREINKYDTAGKCLSIVMV